MSALLQQAVLALGAGATVAIAGQGVVQIYRGSGVLNFAHGAFALAAAQVFAWAWADQGWPLAPAIVLAVGTGAVLGLLTHLLVMRPLRAASPLVRIIATIGVLQVVQQGTQLVFGSEPRSVGSFLPAGAVSIGDTNVQRSALVLLAIAVGLTAVLRLTMTYSRFGLATRAVAESELVSRSLGHSPDRVAAANWTLGGALAGLAGVLVVPIGGVAIASILLMAVPAFAAAVLGGFRSYVITTVGAVLIASGQAILTFQSVAHGWPASLAPSLPFLVVVAALVLRSSSLPARDHVAARLPRVGTTPVPRWAPAIVVVAAALALLAPVDLANALITTTITAIVGLSLVVITGLTGQISLAQFAIAGLGALAAARASDIAGWPFPVCAALGVIAAAAAGAVLALPSLRTRGPALAVVTIGVGLAVQQGVLADIRITGGFNGATPVERPTLLGVEVDAVEHPARYAALTIVLFGVLAMAVTCLRRSDVGRRMLAVRGNERAAAALGISVPGVKIYAFTLASAIAGVGGVLLAFRFDTVQYAQFSFSSSLQLVSYVLIGGIGFVLGPLVGALGVPSGILAWTADGIGDLERWLVLGAGALLVITLVQAPDGAVALVVRQRDRRAQRRASSQVTRREAGVSDEPAAAPGRWRSAPLDVEDLGVRFRDVVALDGVSLSVRPGHVTGLIGANGAGKTTLIDAVSGFVRPTTGRVRLGDDDLTSRAVTARSRAGVARCFQSIDLFDDLDVRRNLLVADDRRTPWAWLRALVAPGRPRLSAETRWVAEQLDLADLLDRSPAELSHGQRRLVGVARAVAGHPAVLLLDEPAAGLDRAETERLGTVVRRLADLGLGVLLVEHDVDLVLRVSDHVVAIDTGRTIYDGPPDGVRTDPAVRRAYLGTTPAGAEVAGDVTAVPS